MLYALLTSPFFA
jgi:hypothetical protein